MITTSEGLELEVVTSYKYLGVLLSAHITAAGKVKSRLGFFYHNNRSSFTPTAKLTLIQMTVLPITET